MADLLKTCAYKQHDLEHAFNSYFMPAAGSRTAEPSTGIECIDAKMNLCNTIDVCYGFPFWYMMAVQVQHNVSFGISEVRSWGTNKCHETMSC